LLHNPLFQLFLFLIFISKLNTFVFIRTPWAQLHCANSTLAYLPLLLIVTFIAKISPQEQQQEQQQKQQQKQHKTICSLVR
jgi:membrane protein insertase Oxa1/YidC/SpoIIIJ